MLAARMHEYHKPLVLEQVQEAKNLSGENVLVKVGGAGICRTDLQMIDGYFREYLDLDYLLHLVMKLQDGLKRSVIWFLKILSKEAT
jgi:D-arabinose 1-dehydrogenase-like Zn-dependent alcohol dehydrogenase